MNSSKKIIIIGAGIVGASLADELTARGQTDVTIVDKGRFPSFGGSSSHAPGMIFQVHQTPTMLEMSKATVEKFGSLSDDAGPLWTQTGSLELALDDEWIEILRQRHDFGLEAGLAVEVLSPEQSAELQPLVDPAAFRAGLYNPTDGVVHAVRAVAVRLKSAIARGARLLEGHEVTDMLVEDGKVRGIRTDKGDFYADLVVVCAGLWGKPIAAMAGEYIPVQAFIAPGAHTGPLPTLAGSTADARGPIVRFADFALTWRERGETVEFGYSRHEATPVDPAELPSVDQASIMPSVLEFEPTYVDRGWPLMQRLVPDARGVSYERGQHGVMATTADFLPLLGPSSKTEGLWYAESIWVTHSAGAALAVAEWIVDGQCTSFDVTDLDVRRFDGRDAAELDELTIKNLDFFAFQKRASQQA